MATITQGQTAKNIMLNKSSLGDSDVLFRNVIYPVRVVGSLNYQPQPSTATLSFYGGDTEGLQDNLLATMTFSTNNGELMEVFTIYNTYQYIKATVSAISGTNANVTVSVNALE